MRLLALMAAFVSPVFAASAYASAPAQCSTILPGTHLPAGKRALTPEDLARLRDIGPPDPQGYGEPIFTLSPDGRKAAFQLRQGIPELNNYCLAMVVVDLSGKVPPRLVDEGGEVLLLAIDFRGIADFPMGYLRIVTPRWSPDGKWIAFLKRAGGSTQVWRAFTDGSGSGPLTHSDVDVADFRLSEDGSSIVYATRPGIGQQQSDIESEGLNGWHYDERFAPFLAKRPLPATPVAREVQVLDLASGRVREPTGQEAALVVPDRRIIANAGVPAETGAEGLTIGATDLSGGAREGSFRARLAGGSERSCSNPACNGATSPWWTDDTKHVRFFRREGWANASTAIYDWDVEHGAVSRLYLTDDVLSSCASIAQRVLCRIDSSLEPGRLVLLDPKSGKRRTLFDPNPEFARLTLGKPERLHWKNAYGSETIGDLVLPVGYRKGAKVPLIVVQYETRGFLRGGTDDEYPIQAFANRGFAVLSFKRPQMTSLASAKDYEEAGRKNLEKFADRRNVHASLEAGVKLIIGRGIADPAKIGITGLSDGSSTLEWALIHSTLFAAAATSSCCTDSTFVSQVGPSAALHFLGEGYPGLLERDAPFWKEVSLSDNAQRMATPLLINASEEEFLDTLFTFSALREAKAPVDLFVYPGEYHARWQPAHRLATYKRSLDWFDYWLRGIRSSDPARQSELKEWDRLKAIAAERSSDQSRLPH